MTLLPYQRRIADLMGLTEDEYLHFVYECRRLSREELEGETVCGTVALAIGAIVVGIGSSLALAALAPKPPTPPAQPGDFQIQENIESGGNIRANRSAVQASGFSATQQVAAQGTIIPVVYARDENGTGGARVNLKLVFSQVLSLQSHEMARLLYVIGQGEIGGIRKESFAFGDNTLASYLLGTYENPEAFLNRGGRFSMYFRPGMYAPGQSNRIRSSDHVLGRAAHEDVGNQEVLGGGRDVYSVAVGGSPVWRNYNCMSGSPSSSTAFGLTDPIGNNMGYRINPVIRPTKKLSIQGVTKDFAKQVTGYVRTSVRTDKDGNISDVSSSFYGGTMNFRDNNTFVAWVDDDTAALGQVWKAIYVWSCRSGLVERATDIRSGAGEWRPVGSELIYELSTDSDANNVLLFDRINVDSGANTPLAHREPLGEIGAAVATRQRQWDAALVEGELYRIGSCLAILTRRETSRGPGYSFSSYADTEPYGQFRTFVRCRFRVVEAGQVASPGKAMVDKTTWGNSEPAHRPPQTSTGGAGAANEQTNTFEAALNQKGEIQNKFSTATNFSQIFRVVNAGFTLARPAYYFEVGIQSKLGIQVSGFCNFRDARDMDKVNRQATRGYGNAGLVIDNTSGDLPVRNVDTKIFQSGTMSRTEERYSFWMIEFAETQLGTLNRFPYLIGTKGSSQTQVNTYIRFQMPERRNWRIVFKPISGWEVRKKQLPLGLNLDTAYLLIANTGTTGTDRTIANPNYPDMYIFINGREIRWGPGHSPSNPFKLEGLEPKDTLYMNRHDSPSMIDDYGRLAEMFVYDEITTSVSSTPEHRISYVNIIENPPVTPNYESVALLGLNVRSSQELQSLSQASIDVSYGRRTKIWKDRYAGGLFKASHHWPDVLRDMMLNNRFGAGDLITEDDIDTDSFVTAGQVVENNGWFFDGVIDEAINLRAWAAEVSASMLLRFGENNGRWYLRQARPLGTVAIKASFTPDNITEGTFQLTWRDALDVDPPVVAVTYRNRRQVNDPGALGLIPSVMPEDTTILVREAGTPETARVIPLDLTGWVVNKRHAVDAAKFYCREIRLSSHDVTFETQHDASVTGFISPDDYIYVDFNHTFANDVSTGVIQPDGTIISSTPLSDGPHTIYAWDGIMENEPTQQNINVTAGVADLADSVHSHIFSLRYGAYGIKRCYRITKISPTDDGRYSIEATYSPLNASGGLKLAENWDTSTGAWVVSS